MGECRGSKDAHGNASGRMDAIALQLVREVQLYGASHNSKNVILEPHAALCPEAAAAPRYSTNLSLDLSCLLFLPSQLPSLRSCMPIISQDDLEFTGETFHPQAPHLPCVFVLPSDTIYGRTRCFETTSSLMQITASIGLGTKGLDNIHKPRAVQGFRLSPVAGCVPP